jgi:hypothetical protein
MPGKMSNNDFGKNEAGAVANAEYSRCNAIRVAAGEACVRLRSSRQT